MLGKSITHDPKAWGVLLFVFLANAFLPGRVDARGSFDAASSAARVALERLLPEAARDSLDHDAATFAAIAVAAMEVCFWSTVAFYETLDRLKLLQVRRLRKGNASQERDGPTFSHGTPLLSELQAP